MTAPSPALQIDVETEPGCRVPVFGWGVFLAPHGSQTSALPLLIRSTRADAEAMRDRLWPNGGRVAELAGEYEEPRS